LKGNCEIIGTNSATKEKAYKGTLQKDRISVKESKGEEGNGKLHCGCSQSRTNSKGV
jgi:hypothetical protein